MKTFPVENIRSKIGAQDGRTDGPDKGAKSSYLMRTPACDGQTDGQTDRDRDRERRTDGRTDGPDKGATSSYLMRPPACDELSANYYKSSNN